MGGTPSPRAGGREVSGESRPADDAAAPPAVLVSGLQGGAPPQRNSQWQQGWRRASAWPHRMGVALRDPQSAKCCTVAAGGAWKQKPLAPLLSPVLSASVEGVCPLAEH